MFSAIRGLTDKERTGCRFDKNYETGLFTVKSHLLYHLCENLNRFGTVRFLYASAYEHYIVFLKRANMRTIKEKEVQCGRNLA